MHCCSKDVGGYVANTATLFHSSVESLFNRDFIDGMCVRMNRGQVRLEARREAQLEH